jgi:hypothetical protein
VKGLDETGEGNFKILGDLLTETLARLGNRAGEKTAGAAEADTGSKFEETQALDTAERASHFRSERGEIREASDAGERLTRSTTPKTARRNGRMPPQRLLGLRTGRASGASPCDDQFGAG